MTVGRVRLLVHVQLYRRVRRGPVAGVELSLYSLSLRAQGHTGAATPFFMHSYVQTTITVALHRLYMTGESTSEINIPEYVVDFTSKGTTALSKP